MISLSALFELTHYTPSLFIVQVYHLCNRHGGGMEFSCPRGTRFQQRTMVCSHKRNVDCQESELFYDTNLRIGQQVNLIDDREKIIHICRLHFSAPVTIHVNHYLGAVATLAFSRRVWNQTLFTFTGKVCNFRVCICNLGSVFRGKVCNLGSVFPGIAYQGPSCIPWACRIRGMVCKIC